MGSSGGPRSLELTVEADTERGPLHQLEVSAIAIIVPVIYPYWKVRLTENGRECDIPIEIRRLGLDVFGQGDSKLILLQVYCVPQQSGRGVSCGRTKTKRLAITVFALETYATLKNRSSIRLIIQVNQNCHFKNL